MPVSGRKRWNDDLLTDVTLGRSATDVFRDIRERIGGLMQTHPRICPIVCLGIALNLDSR